MSGPRTDPTLAEREAAEARQEEGFLGETEEEGLTELQILENPAPTTLAEMAQDEEFRRDFEDWLDGLGEKR